MHMGGLLLGIFVQIFFGGTGLWIIATSVLFMIGLWLMFKKSDVPSWWALCPWAKHYWLAKCGGREEAGRVTSIMDFLITLISVLGGILITNFEFFQREEIAMMVLVAELICEIIKLVYSVQVYNGLIEVYGVSRKWLILWIPLHSVAALIWGVSPKLKPTWKVSDFRDSAISHITGGEVEDIGEGLTVNLKERSVTEFFQKKMLLKDIHMNIKPGRLVMLLGGSGAGKTTYLNAINGYEKADAKVILNGRDVYKEYSKMQYECGFVPQSDLMRGKDTAYNTLYDAARLRLPAGYTSKDRKERVEEALNVFGLTRARNTQVEKMSGGQRKRLSIAMEFLSNPYLFILDEPDSGLDGVMARELFLQLRKIADTGRIVLVITHTPDRVVDLFDDVIILAKDSDRVGRLAFYGPVDECRKFFGKDRMEEVVKTINNVEEGGEGRADEFIMKYAEAQHV